MKEKFKKKCLFAFLFILILSGLYFTHPLYLSSLGHFFIVSDPLKKSDAIIVLDGDYPKDERLLHAIQLWQQGYAPVIILSAKLAEWQTFEDYPTWRHAMKLKIFPADALLIAAHDADSTKGETAHLLKFVREHNFRKIIIVTSNYHSRRAQGVFRKEWKRSGVEVFVSAASSSKFHPHEWWLHREDSKTFFYESSKTIWYFLME